MPPSDPSPPCPLPAGGLPLTAFEEYMFLDDRPSHPMVIVARFDFAAAPPDGIADAFAAAVGAEPLLGGRIDAPARGRPRWLPASPPVLDVRPARDCGTGGLEDTPPLPRLDPRRGPMLHARVDVRAEGWSLVVAAHHAACDGLGLVGFVERWLARASGAEVRRERPAAERWAALRGRGRIAASWREWGRIAPRLCKGLEGVQQFVTHEVAALGGPPGAGPAGAADSCPATWRPAVVTTTLDERVAGLLDRRAKAAGVMVNDLLLTALAVALGRHLDEAPGPDAARGWIRLATPMSLRSKSDQALPAANRVSMVFLDRRAADRFDEAALARSFKAEMDVIRTHHLGHIFPLSLAAGRWLPGGIRGTTRRPKPQATAVLSNLGRCFHHWPAGDEPGGVRFGDCRLEGWWIVPPVRPGTALAAATHQTHGRRTIAFHFDAAHVSAATAGGWLDAMRGTLERMATDAVGAGDATVPR